LTSKDFGIGSTETVAPRKSSGLGAWFPPNLGHALHTASNSDRASTAYLQESPEQRRETDSTSLPICGLVRVGPQFAEQFDCGRCEALVMIICKQKCALESSLHNPHPHQFYPLHKIVGSVHDHFVPSCRSFFYAFAISKPPDIDEVRRDEIELFLHLPRSRHKRCVGQRAEHSHCFKGNLGQFRVSVAMF